VENKFAEFPKGDYNENGRTIWPVFDLWFINCVCYRPYAFVNKISKQTGFTLVEMLVAIAVALVFMGGVLLSRGDFDSTVRLGSITREVALFAREAQTYGAGGRTESTVNTSRPHGIYKAPSSDSEIILYADEDDPADGYQPSDETLKTLQLPDGYVIANPTNEFDVYFTRPTLRASDDLTITIEHSKSGNTREAEIDSSGYISTP